MTLSVASTMQRAIRAVLVTAVTALDRRGGGSPGLPRPTREESVAQVCHRVGMDELIVRKNAEQGRYEAFIDGELAGYSDFEIGGGFVTFPHTVTEPEYGGQGVATAVVRYSLDDVRKQGLKVRPVCSFYVDYLRKHPEVQDLL